jgi:hypothetical protein
MGSEFVEMGLSIALLAIIVWGITSIEWLA